MVRAYFTRKGTKPAESYDSPTAEKRSVPTRLRLVSFKRAANCLNTG